MSPRIHLLPQLNMVVNLSIADHRNSPIFIEQRLRTTLNIDDG
jgi:hypothetical protein